MVAADFQRPSEPRHPDVYGVAGGVSSLLPEQLLGQLIDRHQLVGVHQQQRQQRSLALAAQANLLTGAHSLKGSEDPESQPPRGIAPHQAPIIPSPAAPRNGCQSACKPTVSQL